MNAPELTALVEQLRSLDGLHAKRDIQAPAAVFGHHPFAELGEVSRLGDDAAVVPAQSGSLLLACEGMHPELVNDDPWFAGWSGVLVNLSDIAAMGGRPLALVNSVWSAGEQAVAPLLAGMRFACDKFSIPMVGGHTNSQSPYTALSVAVLGVAEGPVLSARAAQSGDLLVLLIDREGSFYRHYPFWDAATTAEPSRLQSQLALLPRLAQAGITRAAKDISMGGLVGTAAMFAEACGCGLTIDLNAIPRPPEIDELAWLSCFPSFGFLLAVSSGQLNSLQQMVSGHPNLICASIGSFEADCRWVCLRRNEQTQQLWDGTTSLTGFGAVVSP